MEQLRATCRPINKSFEIFEFFEIWKKMRIWKCWKKWKKKFRSVHLSASSCRGKTTGGGTKRLGGFGIPGWGRLACTSLSPSWFCRDFFGPWLYEFVVDSHSDYNISVSNSWVVPLAQHCWSIATGKTRPEGTSSAESWTSPWNPWVWFWTARLPYPLGFWCTSRAG